MINQNEQSVPSRQTSEVMSPPFRWRMIAYAAAVVVAASAAAGPLMLVRTVHSNDVVVFGLMAGLGVVGFWIIVWMSGFTREALLKTVGIGIWIAVILVPFLVTPAIQTREASRRLSCAHHLMNLQLALINYHDAHHAFPPLYAADGKGKPLYSWRVLVLPYLDRPDIYKQYHFDEPWNSAENRRLANLWIPNFSCPALDDRNGNTTYLAVTGPGTVWSEHGGITLTDIADGPEQTVMLLEVPQRPVNWSEPRDITIDEAVELLSGQPKRDDKCRYVDGSMTTADGKMHAIPYGLSASEWTALFTMTAGDPAPDIKSLRTKSKLPGYNLLNVIALAIFIILALLPTPSAWSRRSEQLRVA